MYETMPRHAIPDTVVGLQLPIRPSRLHPIVEGALPRSLRWIVELVSIGADISSLPELPLAAGEGLVVLSTRRGSRLLTIRKREPTISAEAREEEEKWDKAMMACDSWEGQNRS